MNAIEKLLEEAKTKAGITSDNALALEIGIHRQAINNYRKHRSAPDIFTMSRLADLTGRPIEEIIALIEIEKEQPEEKKEYWINFYKRLGGVAASVFVCVTLGLVTFAMTPATANAYHVAQPIDNSVYYVKLYRKNNEGPCNRNYHGPLSIHCTANLTNSVALTRLSFPLILAR